MNIKDLLLDFMYYSLVCIYYIFLFIRGCIDLNLQNTKELMNGITPSKIRQTKIDKRNNDFLDMF